MMNFVGEIWPRRGNFWPRSIFLLTNWKKIINGGGSSMQNFLLKTRFGVWDLKHQARRGHTKRVKKTSNFGAPYLSSRRYAKSENRNAGMILPKFFFGGLIFYVRPGFKKLALKLAETVTGHISAKCWDIWDISFPAHYPPIYLELLL